MAQTQSTSRLIGMAALLLALLGGCKDHGKASGDPNDLSDVTIIVGTPNKTGLRRQLTAAGETTNLPYKIEWAVFDSTPPLTEALKAGKVDIGGGGETGVLFAIANGAKIAVLAGTEMRDPDKAVEVLVPADSPAHSLADLRGRKIALPYYTAQHYELARALDKAGLPWDRKLILNLNTVDGLSALVNRQVDALIVWDPNAAVAQTRFHARGIGSLRAIVPTAGMLYAAQASVEDPRKKKALQDLTRRIIRAQAWVNDHPEQWAQEMATQAQIPLPAARLTVSRNNADYLPAGDKDVVDRWQKEVDYFHQQGQFQTAFNIRDHLAPGFDAIVADENAKLPHKAGAAQ
ncbi:ABC transporter substrate-binding protein [Novosphingobium terrae]|uniref:ABC transporter substrate-binding protein n=1 Tax=Novosphingobium terrae TaxID=2726189 RepID=UPI001980AB08|nr:ABC transporter substrate-binding protein [Novosphingobium terrae]